MPIVGQTGDLAFSAIKRHFNIKDFGHLFPGHGGMLDRVDSFTFNCLVMYCLIVFYYEKRIVVLGASGSVGW